MTKKKQNNNKMLKGIIVSVVLTVLAIILTPFIFKNLNYGLDLQGGFEVLYKVESIDNEKVTEDMVTSTYKTIMKRIDVLGVSEPEIIVEGKDRIRIRLAGVKDPDQARDQIGKVANLTFRDTSDQLLMKSNVIKSAKATTDQQTGKPVVSLAIKDKDMFYKVTKKVSQSKDQTIVIWLDFENGIDKYNKEKNNCGSLGDSRCISAASVTEGFSSDVIIKGNFSQDEAKNLAELISSGSLQTKLKEISSKTVTASFGQDSLSNTLKAGIIGLVLVIILMIVLYRFSGLIASVGLLVYATLTFFIFWLIGGVLTLPGIAATLLGIGMAVDSNVINYAKIKDELRNGKSFREAYLLGNKSSFMTIIDSNITTLIVAIILFVFGESSVKGFATMLIISIVVTLFVMVGLVRWILNIFVKSDYFDNRLKLFVGYKEKHREPKLRCTFKYILVSIIIILIGMISLGVNKLNLGVDFRGGSSINLKGESISKSEIKDDLNKLGYKLRTYDETNDSTTFLIEQSLSEKKVVKTKDYFEKKYDVSADIGVVSNVVKRELVKNTIYSIILATIGILLYISFRFTMNYAIGGVVALIHDVLITIGVFAFFRLQVDTIFIAAILSIIGYSINDTVVMFDRIRDLKKHRHDNKIKTKKELNELVDECLGNIIGRNMVTTITTLIPIICLIFLGSKSILNFNIAMLVGVGVGSYSSLFIAAYIWKKLEEKDLGKKEKKQIKKKEEKDVKGVNC